MSKPEGGLHTLTYRVDPAVLGDVVLYPLSASFQTAWDGLVSKTRRRAGRGDIMPRYSDLATALAAVTGQPVRLFASWELSPEQRGEGVTALLITTEPIDPWVLDTATRAFERLQARDDGCDTLAACLTAIEPAVMPVSSFVLVAGGRVKAPGWVYDVARWTLAARIAEAPLMVDGHRLIQFRLDTKANLVSWEDPITQVWSTGTRSAMVYLDTSVVTLPGAADLYFRLDAHVARMPPSWNFVKNAWVDRGDTTRPLLRLPIRPPWPERGRSVPEYMCWVAEIVRECGLEPLTLPPNLPDIPGPVRPIGNPRHHPVGRGPGARTIFQFQQQLQERLELPELVYRQSPLSVGKSATGRVPGERIDLAIDAAGTQRLRIVCLYGSDDTRRRMADALGAYSMDDPAVLEGVANDIPIPVTNRLSVTFHRAPEVIAHGDHHRDLDGLTCLEAADGEAVAALVETEWKRGDAVLNDAKPILRAELGKRGVVTQFLSSHYQASRPRQGRDGSTRPIVDHQAEAAGRDLFRQAGVIDNRLAAATTSRRLAFPLLRRATLVGLHVRQHTPRPHNGIKEPNRLVVQLVAVHATSDDQVPWSVQMYDDADGWISYRDANANYYATDVGKPEFGRTQDKAPVVREYVDQALAALPRSIPIVIFCEAESCRSLWNGLTHNSFGHGLLPGTTIGHPDVAVVRVAGGAQVPRPTHRSHGGQVKDVLQPNLPGSTLYEHDDGGVVSWMLAQPSHVHRSSKVGARAGTMYTRWTLPESRARWMEYDWHALTAIEIAVARVG